MGNFARRCPRIFLAGFGDGVDDDGSFLLGEDVIPALRHADGP